MPSCVHIHKHFEKEFARHPGWRHGCARAVGEMVVGAAAKANGDCVCGF